EGAVFDPRRVLGLPVIVDGHRPGPDVHTPADDGIAQITVMGNLAAGPHLSILQLGEIAHPGAVFQHGSRPQVVEWADADAGADPAFLDDRGADDTAVADPA